MMRIDVMRMEMPKPKKKTPSPAPGKKGDDAKDAKGEEKKKENATVTAAPTPVPKPVPVQVPVHVKDVGVSIATLLKYGILQNDARRLFSDVLVRPDLHTASFDLDEVRFKGGVLTPPVMEPPAQPVLNITNGTTNGSNKPCPCGQNESTVGAAGAAGAAGAPCNGTVKTIVKTITVFKNRTLTKTLLQTLPPTKSPTAPPPTDAVAAAKGVVAAAEAKDANDTEAANDAANDTAVAGEGEKVALQTALRGAATAAGVFGDVGAGKAPPAAKPAAKPAAHLEARRRLIESDAARPLTHASTAESLEEFSAETAALVGEGVASPGRRRLLYLLREDRVGAVAMAEKQALKAEAAAKEAKHRTSKESTKRRRKMRKRKRRSSRLRLTTTPRVSSDLVRDGVGAGGRGRPGVAGGVGAKGVPADQTLDDTLESSVLGHSAKRLSDWSKDHTTHQLQMVDSERSGYERWWLLLRSQLPDAFDGERWSGLVFGRNLGLLSVKLASGYPNSTIVSLKRPGDCPVPAPVPFSPPPPSSCPPPPPPPPFSPQGDYTDAHMSLLSLFKLRNNLLCTNEMSAAVLQRAQQVCESLLSLFLPSPHPSPFSPLRYARRLASNHRAASVTRS
jgi:hypothetical protein